MTQLSMKFSRRRIVVIGLIILGSGTAIAIQNVPRARPVKTYIQAYVAPVFTAAGAMNIAINMAHYLKPPIVDSPVEKGAQREPADFDCVNCRH